MKPIHKFNNGRGATLCNQCSVIISVGLTDDLYCEECNNHRKKLLIEIMKEDEDLGLYIEQMEKEETKQETLSWDELVQEAENKEELIKILKLPHIAPLVREAMRNNCKK
jgi:transcription antitermination factor NusA-like protein